MTPSDLGFRGDTKSDDAQRLGFVFGAPGSLWLLVHDRYELARIGRDEARRVAA